MHTMKHTPAMNGWNNYAIRDLDSGHIGFLEIMAPDDKEAIIALHVYVDKFGREGIPASGELLEMIETVWFDEPDPEFDN